MVSPDSGGLRTCPNDPQRTNPYELTSVLLHRLDITQQILERNMGRAPVIVMGFLEFLMQNKDKLLVVGDHGRDGFASSPNF